MDLRKEEKRVHGMISFTNQLERPFVMQSPIISPAMTRKSALFFINQSVVYSHEHLYPCGPMPQMISPEKLHLEYSMYCFSSKL